MLFLLIYRRTVHSFYYSLDCKASLLIVGSSNAERLQEAVREAGFTANLAKVSGWRITAASIPEMAKEVREQLEKEDVEVVVLFCFDNSCWYGEDDEGVVRPASKSDGRYHIEGDLGIASLDKVTKMTALIQPILEECGDRKMIIIPPLPRYLLRACCQNEKHMPNRAEFVVDIDKKLGRIYNRMKYDIHHMGIRRYRFVYYKNSFAGVTDDELWGEDPVHPRGRCYQLLANSLKVMVRKLAKQEAEEMRGQKKSEAV